MWVLFCLSDWDRAIPVIDTFNQRRNRKKRGKKKNWKRRNRCNKKLEISGVGFVSLISSWNTSQRNPRNQHDLIDIDLGGRSFSRHYGHKYIKEDLRSSSPNLPSSCSKSNCSNVKQSVSIFKGRWADDSTDGTGAPTLFVRLTETAARQSEMVVGTWIINL